MAGVIVKYNGDVPAMIFVKDMQAGCLPAFNVCLRSQHQLECAVPVGNIARQDFGEVEPSVSAGYRKEGGVWLRHADHIAVGDRGTEVPERKYSSIESERTREA